MEFITFKKLNSDLIKNIHKLQQDIDLVVGIPRSGLILANMIAIYLNKPLTDLDSYLKGSIFESGNTKDLSRNVKTFDDVNKVLIVDDTVSSGRAIRGAKYKIAALHSGKKELFLAAYVRSETKMEVDIYFEIIDDERVFEWNYLHNTLLENACLDIDGVLCLDPTISQNDDDERYVDFILNATPKFIPSVKVGYIVTSRLEKYRSQTEYWLRKYNIDYKKLYMMNLGSAEERRRLGNHASFKANVFKRLKTAKWFIESEADQADAIAKITGKMVFCVGNQECYFPGMKEKMKSIIYVKHKNMKNRIKKVCPNIVLNAYYRHFKR